MICLGEKEPVYDIVTDGRPESQRLQVPPQSYHDGCSCRWRNVDLHQLSALGQTSLQAISNLLCVNTRLVPLYQPSESMMACIQSRPTVHQKATLAVNADSTEFCPLDTLQQILAVGTYELEEETQTRHGELCVYRLETASGNCDNQDAASSRIPAWQMQRIETFPLSGIFDLKWQPVQPARLMVACADGSLHVLAVQQAGNGCQVTRQQAVQVSDKGMAVSLDIDALGQQVVSSSSDGSLSVLQVVAHLFLKLSTCQFDTCAFGVLLACQLACSIANCQKHTYSEMS